MQKNAGNFELKIITVFGNETLCNLAYLTFEGMCHLLSSSGKANPEDGDITFLRNVGNDLSYYKASHPRRQ
jgi:hypothetical protein